MDLLNATRMPAAYTMGAAPDGRERLVVVVKGTFTLPCTPGETARLAEQQEPLVMADTFTGEPGFSAPVYEADFAPEKQRCDVLLVGSAHAPDGQPVERLTVGLRVGDWKKAFTVTGERRWQTLATVIRAGRPQPFVHQAISYDGAFGGIDDFGPVESLDAAYAYNPVGKGWHEHALASLVEDTPMPITEELSRPVEKPDFDYPPMAFGPVGRGWLPRREFAGTYDDAWLENTFPFLPADFDPRYYQAAPSDQQMPFPQGGEPVTVLNLSPHGRLDFRLPRVEVPVVFFRKRGERQETVAVIDTLLFEPDANRFSMTWRASLPLKRDLFEIAQVLVGRMSRAWWRARELGKTYYPSLAAAVRKTDEEDLD